MNERDVHLPSLSNEKCGRIGSMDRIAFRGSSVICCECPGSDLLEGVMNPHENSRLRYWLPASPLD
jgi:hypothetical protein